MTDKGKKHEVINIEKTTKSNKYARWQNDKVLNKTQMWRMGTGNVRSLHVKENELIKEFRDFSNK